MIKHVWFDVEETLTVRSDEFKKVHNQLRYETYSKAVGKPLTLKLKQEFEKLYIQYGSNSAVFRSLGYPSDYWQIHYSKLDKTKFYKPVKSVYTTLEKLKEKVPISIFTNLKPVETVKIFKIIKIKKCWFKFIITGDDIKERKPNLEGFYEMIKRTGLSSAEILYVGDRVTVDILPAKKVGIKTCLVWSKSDEADYSFKKFENILTIFKYSS